MIAICCGTFSCRLPWGEARDGIRSSHLGICRSIRFRQDNEAFQVLTILIYKLRLGLNLVQS
jgi:hypothetical protein